MLSTQEDSSTAILLNSAQLLFDLQDVNTIGQGISGCLDPEAIAHQVTQALVERFDCAFARIWLTNADQQALTLVASSGLYTHINGSFARVPMGAYKVGKIAQNRVPFLSNCLPDESWVKDRDWAIANQIRGFAGYPLLAGDRVLGVLATFSHQPMAPEFLEVLQVLCLTTTIALDAALHAQQIAPKITPQSRAVILSDQLARILPATRVMLVGTERELPISVAYAILRTAETLRQFDCSYCRLNYADKAVSLDAIATLLPTANADLLESLSSSSAELQLMMLWLGGTFITQPGPQNRFFELLIQIPYLPEPAGLPVSVQCQQPILQMAFTHLCLQAGLRVSDTPNTCTDKSRQNIVRLTDRPDSASPSPFIWIQHTSRGNVPVAAKAVVTLDVTPHQLHTIVAQINQGHFVETFSRPSSQHLSDREQKIMQLLSQGLRDRDIAHKLHISQSTVRFHVNNTLTKLKAKNRYQAVYEATSQNWI